MAKERLLNSDKVSKQKTKLGTYHNRSHPESMDYQFPDRVIWFGPPSSDPRITGGDFLSVIAIFEPSI